MIKHVKKFMMFHMPTETKSKDIYDKTQVHSYLKLPGISDHKD